MFSITALLITKNRLLDRQSDQLLPIPIPEKYQILPIPINRTITTTDYEESFATSEIRSTYSDFDTDLDSRTPDIFPIPDSNSD